MNLNYTENKAVIGHERIPDNRKLQELGWEARVDIREGFKRVIQYIENEKQWNKEQKNLFTGALIREWKISILIFIKAKKF